MVKGVIFDLDGVICFTDKYHYLAWKKLADRLGIYFDEQINNRLRGVSRMDSLNIILEKSNVEYTQEQKESFAKEKNDEYVKLLKNLSAKDVDNDTRKTLHKLKEMGIKIAVGSSSKNTPLILKQIELDTLFDFVADGNCITHSKPHPEVFLKAAEGINLEPKDCLVVEDAISGIDAGLNGGFRTIAIGDARKHPHTTYKINEIKDILDIVA